MSDKKKDGTRHEVEFRLVSNLIVVDAELNGVKKPFIVDTGASHTVLDTRTVAELELDTLDKAEKACGVGAQGPVEASMGTLESISVGTASLNDVSFGAVDLSAICGGEIKESIGGILGFNFLSRFKIGIDYGAKVLSLE